MRANTSRPAETAPQASHTPPADTTDREIRIWRDYDAPRELVWEAMTNPAHVVHWWGPRGFSTTIEHMDVRPGGEWKHVMRGPDGVLYPNHSTFIEVVRPERIVYNLGGHRENGPSVRAVSTWTFEALSPRRTRVTIHMVFPTAAERDFVVKEFGAIEGARQTLARLAEHLPTMQAAPALATAGFSPADAGKQFVVTRTFNAPRELVFKAWTETERLRRWWGPKGMSMIACTNDLRVGGVFHYGMRTPTGQEMWGRWVYREISPPETLAFVVSFSDKDGGIVRAPFSADWPLEVLSTITLTEHAGQTTVTMRGEPINATDAERRAFDGMSSSMQQGWAGTLDQLAEELARG